ncbi:MAG: AraC family transcriptional regulator [Chthoniobacter sp.]
MRAQECPALALHHIAHVGLADAAAPYEMVRMDLSGTYLLSCSAGRGQILLDGRWQTCREGWACLAPPHALLAFRAIREARWEFTWVRYQQPPDQKPVISSSSPALARFDPRPLRAAVQGLFAEMQSQTAPAAVSHWVELIHTYVLRFARPWQTDDRLGHLWEHVAARLGEPWSLDRLARHCHLSTEHLRRLCRRELGRSPMHHVIFLACNSPPNCSPPPTTRSRPSPATSATRIPSSSPPTFKKWVGWAPERIPGAARG